MGDKSGGSGHLSKPRNRILGRLARAWQAIRYPNLAWHHRVVLAWRLLCSSDHYQVFRAKNGNPYMTVNWGWPQSVHIEHFDPAMPQVKPINGVAPWALPAPSQVQSGVTYGGPDNPMIGTMTHPSPSVPIVGVDTASGESVSVLHASGPNAGKPVWGPSWMTQYSKMLPSDRDAKKFQQEYLGSFDAPDGGFVPRDALNKHETLKDIAKGLGIPEYLLLSQIIKEGRSYGEPTLSKASALLATESVIRKYQLQIMQATAPDCYVLSPLADEYAKSVPAPAPIPDQIEEAYKAYNTTIGSADRAAVIVMHGGEYAEIVYADKAARTIQVSHNNQHITLTEQDIRSWGRGDWTNRVFIDRRDTYEKNRTIQIERSLSQRIPKTLLTGLTKKKRKISKIYEENKGLPTS